MGWGAWWWGQGVNKKGAKGLILSPNVLFHCFSSRWPSPVKFIDWLFAKFHTLRARSNHSAFWGFHDHIAWRLYSQNCRNPTVYQKFVFLWIKVFFASMLRRSLFFIWTLEWSGKMEHAMERTLEWASHGQMEPSSANYGPVQLIPMVTQMKDQALCISSCSFSIHYLFIWKCTPFSWASQKCHLREMASSGKKTELMGQKHYWWTSDKEDGLCYYSYSTCFVEVKKKSTGTEGNHSLGNTIAHALKYVPLAWWSNILPNGYAGKKMKKMAFGNKIRSLL